MLEFAVGDASLSTIDDAELEGCDVARLKAKGFAGLGGTTEVLVFAVAPRCSSVLLSPADSCSKRDFNELNEVDPTSSSLLLLFVVEPVIVPQNHAFRPLKVDDALKSRA